VLDELAHQVDAFDLMVFGRGREPALHAGRKRFDDKRTGGQGLGRGEVGHDVKTLYKLTV
jgi:hypothetical protein